MFVTIMNGSYRGQEVVHQTFEMVKDVKDSMGDDVSILLVDAMQATRCWVAVRKCGYKQMRDECFQLFVADVLESIARRK
jgi:hypothetical protein